MNILIVEDDELTAEFVKKVFSSNGHSVSVSSDGISGLKKAKQSRYDAIILDISLPGVSGLDICSELRSEGVTTPILILSSYSDEDTRVEGLDRGADDYLCKPFGYKELLARVRTITRRPSRVLQSSLKVGEIELNQNSRTVCISGKSIPLRPKEFDLLLHLMQNPDIALPKHELLRRVWHVHTTSASNRLEVYIRHLRSKLGVHAKHIQTVRGIGYKITLD